MAQDAPEDLAPIADALAASPSFSPLAADDRAQLAGSFRVVRTPAGGLVVAKGDLGRSLFLVLSGELFVSSDGLEIARLGPGDSFGELGLVLGTPRAATVTASSEASLAELTRDAYLAVSRDRPGLAVALLEALLRTVAANLAEMTESVRALLHERSLPGRRHVHVRVGGEARLVRTGTAAGDLLPAEQGGHAVVAALLDRRAVSLLAPLTSDGELAALTTRTLEGQRVARNSLGLLLVEAAGRLDPPARIRLDHSLGFGQRVRVIQSGGRSLPALARDLEREMEAIVQSGAALREERWTIGEARAYFEREGDLDVVALLGTVRGGSVAVASYGRTYALALGAFVASPGRIAGSRLLATGDALLLVFEHGASSRPRPWEASDAEPDEDEGPPGGMPGSSARIRAVGRVESVERAHRRWLSTLRIKSVGEFNAACVRGDVAQLIRVAEGFQEKRLGQVADAIAGACPGLKVVMIAGPSSSGKTTFIKRLSVQLQVAGIQPVSLSLDDYYLDRDRTPKDADGEYDFESLHALRLDLFEDHLARAVGGEPVRTARFDFVAGKSHPEGGPLLRLRRDEVLLIEGIHGLNPRLLRGIPEGCVFRVFVCPLSQLPFDAVTRVRVSDVRLLRRIVRDRHSRATDAATSIRRWPSVRRGESRHIFPHQDAADAVFDSSLIYEPSVLKVFAERYLLEVRREDPAYTTAARLQGLLDPFVSIDPDHVPPTSILREFIGGSGFERWEGGARRME